MESKIKYVKELAERLNRYCDAYYNKNIPIVEDAVYDRLYDELVKLEKETNFIVGISPTQKVGAMPVSSLEKTTHEIPLLSLDKTKFTDDLMQFIGEQKVLLMLKMDGLTIKLTYEHGTLIEAATRGNGEMGEVVTHNALQFQNIPVSIPYQGKLIITGEAFIHTDDFEILKDVALDEEGRKYKTARGLASGSVRSFDPNICFKRKVYFVPFQVLEGFEKEVINSKYARLLKLKTLGFDMCNLIYVGQQVSVGCIENYIKALEKKAKIDKIPYDGVVVSYDNITFARSCGKTEHHFKDGVAFKFQDDLYETVFNSIEWSTTRTGIVVPVAIFETIEIDGTDISRASLHNVSFIEALCLKSGDRILVSKRNMIIPHIEENLDKDETDLINIPEVCPSCGRKLAMKTSQGKENKEVKFCIVKIQIVLQEK